MNTNEIISYDLSKNPNLDQIRMKTGMFYGYEKCYDSFEAFSAAVRDYIDYYNNERIQKKTKWMPPVKYRQTSMCLSN